MPDPRTLAEKLAAMAADESSPREAGIARDKLATMAGRGQGPPPRPPAPPTTAPGPFEPEEWEAIVRMARANRLATEDLLRRVEWAQSDFDRLREQMVTFSSGSGSTFSRNVIVGGQAGFWLGRRPRPTDNR